MAQTVTSDRRDLFVSERNLTATQRLIVRRFHPSAIFIDLAAGIWFTYFFWNHEWVLALFILVGGRIAAYSVVWQKDLERLSQTVLGKIALLHLHPLNMAIQLIGTVPLLYGIWAHSVEYILMGLSVILLGHMVGWEKVDSRF